MSNLIKLTRYLTPHRKDYIEAMVYSIINKVFDIMPEILIGIAVDTVVRKNQSWLGHWGIQTSMGQLSVLGFLTLCIWALESITEYRAVIGWRKLGQVIQHNLRVDAYSHIQKLPLSFFEKHSTGRLLSILNDDINQIERFVENGIHEIIQIILSTIIIGAIFFYVSPLLAILAILPIPFLIYGSFYFQGKLSHLFSRVREQASHINSKLTNNILGIFTIKCFHAEDLETVSLAKDSRAYQNANQEAIRFSSLITPIIRMGVLFGFTITLLYGGYLTLNGLIKVGSIAFLFF